jgi:hypothetical protein
MKKILLLMSFIGAGYAASCENLPKSLVQSLTEKGNKGAQYVLVVNKYNNQPGYYADVWKFDGKELKRDEHIADVDISKIIGSGAKLAEGKEAPKDLFKFENLFKEDKEKKSKKTKEKSKKQAKSKSKKEDIKQDKVKKEVKKPSKKSSKTNDLDTKKDLASAKADNKKSNKTIEKAKTKKTKKTAQSAARAKSGKILAKSPNAVK